MLLVELVLCPGVPCCKLPAKLPRELLAGCCGWQLSDTLQQAA